MQPASRMTDIEFQELLENIRKNETESELKLDRHCLYSQDCVALALALRENNQIKSIDLSWNFIGICKETNKEDRKGIQAFADLLNHNFVIQEIDFRFNRMGDYLEVVFVKTLATALFRNIEFVLDESINNLGLKYNLSKRIQNIGCQLWESQGTEYLVQQVYQKTLTNQYLRIVATLEKYSLSHISVDLILRAGQLQKQGKLYDGHVNQIICGFTPEIDRESVFLSLFNFKLDHGLNPQAIVNQPEDISQTMILK